MGKRVDREGPVQRSIVSYLRTVMPDAIVHHAKGEIKKSGDSIRNELAQAKRNGALPGFPDLVILPFSTVGAFFLEVKPEGAYASKVQKEMHEKMRGLGYRVAVVRSIDDVRECLMEWGVGFTENVPFRGTIG